MTAPPEGGIAAAVVHAIPDYPHQLELVLALLRQPLDHEHVPRHTRYRTQPIIDGQRMPPELAPLVRDPGRDRHKLAGRPYWEMEAAWLHDLAGWSTAQVARFLGRADPSVPGQRWKELVEGRQGRSRTAERYYTAGRRLLCALGAWPWAHAPDGTLPQAWHRHQQTIAPLAEWHERWWADAARALNAARP
jgi:hypothetical protein